MFPSVSIIIAVKKNNRFLEQCVEKALALDYPFFEIIILPDEMIGIYNSRQVSIIATGPILPAAKRDIGVAHARGEIIAFIDDDTYPNPSWLKHAVLHFKDETVAAVGGPAVTPADEPFLQKASGKIFESLIVTGPARFRYIPMAQRTTDDFPSCNFLVRKEIFNRIGGFNTKFWPGEDTVFCLELAHTLKKKIIYDPLALLCHHRRPVFRRHCQQIASYALHRGYFVKRFPKTSLRAGYFMPSAIVAALLFSLLGAVLINSKLFYIFLSYILIVMFFSFKGGVRLFPFVFCGIILSHLTYGFYFVKGMLSRKLKEE